MILFILEGKKREDYIFKSMEYIYFPGKKDNVICSYGNNIYNLYKRLNEDGEDIASIILTKLLQDKEPGITENTHISDFAEVYLFFDYDNQDQSSSDEKINEMLNFFDDETGNGKLYISYPMIESIYYTKKLPDKNYYTYVYLLQPKMHFKTEANKFSDYKSFDFIAFRAKKNKLGKLHIEEPTSERIKQITENWNLLQEQNVCKANYICSKKNNMPQNKAQVSQKNIFEYQKLNYIQQKKEIAILNSFTMFLYDYF